MIIYAISINDGLLQSEPWELPQYRFREVETAAWKQVKNVTGHDAAFRFL